MLERNHGGDLLTTSIDTTVPVKLVVASWGKVTQVELVAALYEQDKVSHAGSLSDLEDQMCIFTPMAGGHHGPDDRVDALVWAMTELAIGRDASLDPVHIYHLGGCSACGKPVLAPPWPQVSCEACGWRGRKAETVDCQPRPGSYPAF